MFTGGTRMNGQHLPRRRKRRPMNGVKTVEVVRGTVGYGFTISGQNPCTLSCIVSGSPAEAIGLKPGDFLLAVNGENVSKYPHDEVVRIIGTSVGTLTLQVAENVNSSDSSDDDVPQRQKFHHPNRTRPRRVLKECNHKNIEGWVTANQSHDPAKIPYSSTSLKSKPAILTEISNIWDLDNQKHDKQESIVENVKRSAFHNFTHGSSLHAPEQTVKVSNFQALKSHSMDDLNSVTNLRSGRMTAPISTAMSLDSEESEDEWSPERFPNSNKHFVVGYIGSIEMPGDKNWQHAHLQSFHSAVRRLRSEKKIHTLVVMNISTSGVKLTNTVRKVLAIYPVNKIAFCGLCPDDNHFFGIVTLHGSTEDDVGNANILPSCSCHVFRVNPDMRPHCMHAQKARIFQFQCTHGSQQQRCYEFPKTAVPVIRPISKLYKGKWKNNNNNNNNNNNRKVPMAKLFMEPQLTTDQILNSSSSSSSHSSNSDSGLGFSKDDGVFVVDMNQTQQPFNTCNRMTSSMTSLPHRIQHLSPSVDIMPTPQSAFRQTAKLNAHTKVLPNKGDPKQGRLTLRAMPDPVLTPSVPATVGGGCFPHQKYRSRLNVEHRSRSRESVRKKSVPELAAASSSERPLDFRSVSAPFHQLSNGKLTVVENTENPESMADKLSPRATSVVPKAKVRSPSAPPRSHSAHKDSDWSPDIRRPLEEIFAIFEKDNQDDSEIKTESRRFSEGPALLSAHKATISKDEPQQWKKAGSFRRPKISKLSHSHESLIVNENDVLLHNKIAAANSIHSIVNHNDTDGGPGKKVSRVASWAVSFNRLLEDSEGLLVFTEFLGKEFSEENIHFWLAVDNFKRSMDPEERNIMATDIFEKHLGAKATEPVNVDSLARQTAQEHLHAASHSMFDAAQKQIFQLMKQDSYSRFLKSNLYKSQLMAEMGAGGAGKATETNLKKTQFFSKSGKEMDKKKLTKCKEEEKRRWSLLPWKQKSAKQSEMQKLAKLSKEESRRKISLATMDLSLMRKEVIQNKDPSVMDNFKFCRVLLPDNSTAVVCARPGQTIQQVLGQLFDKRNLTLESTEVFLLGSEKPLDLSEDMSTLGSKEVNVERRAFFHVEISSEKVIGVKAKPNKTIYDVFRPILQKYGYKIDCVDLQLNGQQDALDLQMPVSTIHDAHICVLSREDVFTPGNATGATISAATSLEEITNKVFEDLMHGKSESAQPLANTGLSIHHRKTSQPTACQEQPDDDPPFLDTYVPQRRGSKELEPKLLQPPLLPLSTNNKMKTKILLPNKDQSIPIEGQATKNRELNLNSSDLKQQSSSFSSARNVYLQMKEDNTNPQNISLSNIPVQQTEVDCLINTQNRTFTEDNHSVTTESMSDFSFQLTKPPISIWLQKADKGCKMPRSNTEESMPSWLKSGADARDIQHFKTFGSSPDRKVSNYQKGCEVKTTDAGAATIADRKDIDDKSFRLSHDGFLSCRSKASFIQNSSILVDSKSAKMMNTNWISAAPIASPEEFSLPTDKIRPKISRKPNLKIKLVSPPPHGRNRNNSKSSEPKDETGCVSDPLGSNKILSFIPTSPSVPENEAPQSMKREKFNSSQIPKCSLSVPQSPASLSPTRFQLEVSSNSQVTFV